jgi:hypothetical protein
MTYQEWGRPSISRMGQALHIKNGADPPYQEWDRPFISRMEQHIKNGADPPYQEWGRLLKSVANVPKMADIELFVSVSPDFSEKSLQREPFIWSI